MLPVPPSEALDARGQVTALGRRMAALGTHPRLAHMIERALPLGLSALACDLAGLMRGLEPLMRLQAVRTGSVIDIQVPAGATVSPASGAVMYDITRAIGDGGTTYQLTATPRAGSPMAADACGVYTLSSDGQRTANGNSSGDAFDRCWNR